MLVQSRRRADAAGRGRQDPAAHQLVRRRHRGDAATCRSIRIRVIRGGSRWDSRIAAWRRMAQAGGSSRARSFDEALDVLESDAASPLADRDYMLAGVWANIAIARAVEKTPRPTRSRARRRSAPLASSDLRARRQTVSGSRSQGALRVVPVIAGQLPETAGEGRQDAGGSSRGHGSGGSRASALAKSWEEKGELRFWPLAHDLYRFAEAVYERYQPQFLRVLCERVQPT